MEHIIVTKLDKGFYHLVPEEGYTLYNKVTQTYHSEAVTKTPNNFVAVKIEE